jgi:hypothetical protein
MRKITFILYITTSIAISLSCQGNKKHTVLNVVSDVFKSSKSIFVSNRDSTIDIYSLNPVSKVSSVKMSFGVTSISDLDSGLIGVYDYSSVFYYKGGTNVWVNNIFLSPQKIAPLNTGNLLVLDFKGLHIVSLKDGVILSSLLHVNNRVNRGSDFIVKNDKIYYTGHLKQDGCYLVELDFNFKILQKIKLKGQYGQYELFFEKELLSCYDTENSSLLRVQLSQFNVSRFSDFPSNSKMCNGEVFFLRNDSIFVNSKGLDKFVMGCDFPFVLKVVAEKLFLLDQKDKKSAYLYDNDLFIRSDNLSDLYRGRNTIIEIDSSKVYFLRNHIDLDNVHKPKTNFN